jgi:chorismate lyase/3-hydroxybenzoate synthase
MPPPIRLQYLRARAWDDSSAARTTTQPLGIVGFDADRPAGVTAQCPFARIAIAPLEGEAAYEIWGVDKPVIYDAHDGIRCARTEDLLFGILQLPESPKTSLDSLIYDGYARLFDAVDRADYPHFLRVWNYFPRITGDDDGEQRYRRFTRGRYEAFAARRRPVEMAPAACAIGSRGGPITLYFLSARGAVKPIENPRQVSAYRYPPEHGPRSPTFSRATLGDIGGGKALFVSGTASIVGHESRHLGDPEAQARETIANLRAVLAEADKAGFGQSPASLALKVYLRRPEHLQIVRNCVDDLLRAGETAIYLNADICRPELLLEVEGISIGS